MLRAAGLRAAVALSMLFAGCASDVIEAPQMQVRTDRLVRTADETGESSPNTATLGTLSALSFSNTTTRLDFATYEGSGEVVHPDVVTFPEPWHGHRFWNAITPYPNSAIRYENPSLFTSDDGDSWAVPVGTINPLALTSRGYLSDPDMLYEPESNKLWLYYREVQNTPRKMAMARKTMVEHMADHVWLITSDDGESWSKPRRVTTDSGRFVVSPSIVRSGEGAFSMFQVDAGREGCSSKATGIVRRTSADGIRWTASAPVQLTQPGYTPWHLDVQYNADRSEYWALIAAYPPARGCTATSLFLATSRDGKAWTTYPSPVLAAGDVPQFAAAVYRSTFAFEADDRFTIWFSGARTVRAGAKGGPPVFAWSAAVTHTTLTSLLARVNDKSQTTRLSVTSTSSASRGATYTMGSDVP